MCNFQENIAVAFGVHAAVIAQFIWENVRQENYDGRTYIKDGKKWCRCSVLMMTGFYPFLTRNMIRDAITLLIERKVIVKGCFNQSKFDRTSWYTFTDYGAYLMNKEGDKDG